MIDMLIWTLFALFVAFQIVDAITTARIISHGGSELNPVLRWLIEKFGAIPALVISKGFVVGVVFAIAALSAQSYAVAFLVGADIVYAWVVWHNESQS